ncbi:GTPase ObgE [Candidatus Sneabacter namystus]|uniref:GTPase ObgE n=1 Tax=Candidatus Sneabacter namystus TaxID=2601646 RepID=A0A5C0UIA6_9RICK|nr:GTPase ObgE [Candidatus Sneabacter namystus]QEK39497.1 GTPase ObgE [Candidatus Sneabacter namystus]
MNFCDIITLKIKSGTGGNGVIRFRREKFLPKGGPNGGNGGKGGDVIIVADDNLTSLEYYKYNRNLSASNGQAGKSNNATGKNGANLYLHVPLGTQIFDTITDSLLFDIVDIKTPITILKGGNGGIGNSCFKSSTNKAPRIATEGHKGQETTITLNLKLLSDIALIGLPNSGKSTFLANITSAKPRITNYPFATVIPQIGCLYKNYAKYVIIDMPSITESLLGHLPGHLKHIERSKILIYVIDASTTNTYNTYQKIQNTLQQYFKNKPIPPCILCLSKTDLIDKKSLIEESERLSKLTKKKVFSISTQNTISFDEATLYAIDLIQNSSKTK